MNRPAVMTLVQLLTVMDILRSFGCRFWLQGGWGVDALVGRQTRLHRDVDIDFDTTFEEEVLAALLHVGYAIETDWRPNRVESNRGFPIETVLGAASGGRPPGHIRDTPPAKATKKAKTTSSL